MEATRERGIVTRPGPVSSTMDSGVFSTITPLTLPPPRSVTSSAPTTMGRRKTSQAADGLLIIDPPPYPLDPSDQDYGPGGGGRSTPRARVECGRPCYE